MVKIYNIAHINFNFNLITSHMNKQIEKYEVNSDTYDIKISTNLVDDFYQGNKLNQHTKYYDLYELDEGVLQVQYNDNKEIIGQIIYKENEAVIYLKEANFQYEYLLSQYAVIYYVLKLEQALFIHGSSFVYHNEGILIIAPSGTGKSTHTSLWRKYEDIQMINDDKNIILYENNELYLYPNPFSGKYLLDNNIVVPLKKMVKLKRSEDNSVKLLSKKEGFIALLPSICNTSYFYKKEKWDEMTNHIIEKIKFYQLCCNISKEAVDTLKQALEEDYESK